MIRRIREREKKALGIRQQATRNVPAFSIAYWLLPVA
jgi:hypothetical protein